MILFHWTAAAPWGHVASIIKRSSTGDSLFLLPLLLAGGPFRSSSWRHTYLVPSTSQDPRATSARAELKGTGHTDSQVPAGILSANLHLPSPKLLYINFVARISRSPLSSKAVNPNLYCCWSTFYSFTKRRNKPGFSGFIKIPIHSVSEWTWEEWLSPRALELMFTFISRTRFVF